MSTITLNDVTTQKFNSKIMNAAATAGDAMMKLERDHRTSRDFVAALGTPKGLKFGINGFITGHLNDEDFHLTQHSARQAAEKLGIPAQYLIALASQENFKGLAAHILNEHMQYAPREKMLVRVVGDQVRGILSDKYKRLNSFDLASAFINSAIGEGAVMIDGYCDDTRFGLEVVLPDLIEINSTKNGLIKVAAGCRFMNSDYGDGALTISPYLMNAVCTNGMIRENALRKVHVGSRIADDVTFSDRTMKLETEYFQSIIVDTVPQVFGLDKIKEGLQKVYVASETLVEIDGVFQRLNKDGVTKKELEEVKEILIANRPDDGVQGENTLWKMAQGLTAVAHGKSAARSRELQEIAGKLIG
ncbi:MAG: hypothetical protein KBD83_08540 [Gammaproteobacteria bacterium]|nr:hypothetical protein [Gammaproteobacteria bacterium]